MNGPFTRGFRCAHEACGRSFDRFKKFQQHFDQHVSHDINPGLEVENWRSTLLLGASTSAIRVNDDPQRACQPFRCTVASCEETFSLEKHLELHYHHRHTDRPMSRAYQCACGTYFDITREFRQHIVKDHAVRIADGKAVAPPRPSRQVYSCPHVQSS